MNLPFYIAKRLSAGKNAGTSQLIVRIAIAGVALSVAIMIISMAIVKGYQLEIRNKITGFNTHIQISKLDLNNSFETVPIATDTIMEQLISKQPGITHIQKIGIKAGIIKTTDEFEGVVLKGVDAHYDWRFIKQYLEVGNVLQLNSEPSNDIIISRYLANRLHLKCNDKVVMYFIQDPPRARRFVIKGIYNSGFEEMDKLFVFSDLRQVQKLNNWFDGGISAYEITTDDFTKVDDRVQEILNVTPYNLNVRTVKQLHPELFDWLGLLDLNVVVIIALMVIIACINMITALLILIVERSNMIGILKALGLKNAGVSKVFVIMASYLILLGLFFGNCVGLGICYLQKHFGWVKLDPSAYFIDKVPVKILVSDIIFINIGCFVICYIMLLWPARFVSKISPAKAIRFE